MSATTSARELRTVPVPDPGAAPLRKAALFLHAMAEGDRAWLLAQLGNAERTAIGTLLAELKELGIPADRTLLEEALGRDAARNAPEASAHAAADLEVLRRADPGRLAALLSKEPPLLLARLLQTSDEPWTGELLRSLDGSVRRQVLKILDEEKGSRATLFEKHLLAAISRRVQRAAPPPTPARGVTAWLRRLKGRP